MAEPRDHAEPPVRTHPGAWLPVRVLRELWVCTYQVRRDVTVLQVGGDVDVIGLADLRTAFGGLVGAGNRLVVLDFGRVGFFSVGGVGVLEHTRLTLHDAGIPMRLARPSRAVLRPLTVLGLVGRFDIHAGIGRAITAPSRAA
ncbi:STAS domain-containing protein [Amycolatopsis sp., V23-08]|uniref:STAS domain-containing protein n=1 Tax=Amycolatopsis heterodermiae TaxID=3110235 RepID=A0ABU5RG78_9PSEU|nr:STAS domain-containing protein [Amycolatopsis sp., V23-08]MEA5365273.1 STAS domain-containing protein [Amycolatopsis sp., V23-08]